MTPALLPVIAFAEAWRTSGQKRVAWLVALALTAGGAASASAQDVMGDRTGTIDVAFHLDTRPGGPPGPLATGISTINIHLAIAAPRVSVDRDGRFSFEARGEYHLDSLSTAGGVTVQNNEQRHDALKGAGAIAPDGTLTLRLEWTHGAGVLIYTVNGQPFTAQQPAVATPHGMDWQLPPASKQVEELGEDSRREMTTFAAAQPSTAAGARAASMTERVKVKYERYTGLVPRG